MSAIEQPMSGSGSQDPDPPDVLKTLLVTTSLLSDLHAYLENPIRRRHDRQRLLERTAAMHQVLTQLEVL